MDSNFQQTFLDSRLLVNVGDLTHQDVDSIVNAANSSLMGGGGVDGAIHRAGGPKILQACREIRRTLYPAGLPTGEAVITTGGNLLARHVIHTVGPVYGQNGGRDAELLAACYTNSLRLAARHSLTSIAFPAISTGVFGYPRHEAAGVASEAIQQFLHWHGDSKPALREVRLIFFGLADVEEFLRHHTFD
ncbi:MAG TPA: O-acetyl-ADP-ribose deacetylase [Pyrinomonadaceae bacterium]|nr:O-acetyl-ADP-ribose deacetylase [Pyrinomonadaceae bacterium]